MADWKIYTRTGDAGETSLVGGTRVPKSHERLDIYGTIDELNAHIGLLVSSSIHKQDKDVLIHIQKKLFTIGAEFATDDAKKNLLKSSLIEIDIATLENEIDKMDELLPKLKGFILPGGCMAAAQCHVARTVCRKAERLAVKGAQSFSVNPLTIRYLNRLSDYLFTLSRKINMDFEVEEQLL